MYLLPDKIKQIPCNEELDVIYAAQHGDIVARNLLIESFLPLIINMVNKYTYSGHPQFDDFIQEGILGNIVGIERFNLKRKKQNRYITYGYWWIRSFIQTAARKENDWTSSIDDDISYYTLDNGGEYSTNNYHNNYDYINEDNPSECKVNIASLKYIISDDEFSLMGVDVSVGDIIDQFIDGGAMCNYDLLSTMLEITNGELSTRQREILKLYYHDNLTFREISSKLGISSRWISHLRDRAIDSIKNKVDFYLAE